MNEREKTISEAVAAHDAMIKRLEEIGAAGGIDVQLALLRRECADAMNKFLCSV